jgi:acyl-coenzyme A thioesterase PaaI-like protein
MRERLTKSATFTQCYGCGEGNKRGLGLVFWKEPTDEVTAEFIPDPDHGGYGRIIHGGVTATAIDEALGWAIYGLRNKLGVTTELKVEYLAPLHVGTKLQIRGRIESEDDKGAVVNVTITLPDGKEGARGRGTMRFVPARVIERMGGFSWNA